MEEVWRQFSKMPLGKVFAQDPILLEHLKFGELQKTLESIATNAIRT
jgi:hypothetical protein